MVGAIQADSSARYINAAKDRIHDSTANISSGRRFVADPKVSVSYDRTATTDTADLTGITDPDDPTGSNPPNVSYNQVGLTTSALDSGGEIDAAAEVTRLSSATTQLTLSVDAANKHNEQKKRLIDILA